MNSEHQLIQELERLGSTMASGPSMVAGVMDCVNELPPPVRPSARAPKVVLAGVVTLAACVLVALSAWFANHGDSSSNVAAGNASDGKTSVQEPTEPMEPDSLSLADLSGRDAVSGARLGSSASGGRSIGLSAGLDTFSQHFSRASAVVRARMVATERNNYIIVYRITKLIYGRFPGKTLRQWDRFAGGEGATSFEEGKEVTLYVYREYQRKDGTVICGIHFGASDEGDKRILEIVKSGTHLLPGKGPHNLAFCIHSSQRVVRAKLVKLDDVASHWDVSETVCSSSKSSSGTPVWKVAPKRTGTIAGIAAEKQPSISLSMTPWRLRAEAIVRAQAAQQTDPKQTEKQIQEEFNRLVSTDLKIGRDAILFIRPNNDPAEKAPYWPAFVFPADPDEPGYLDQLAKKIRGIIGRFRGQSAVSH